MSGNAFITGCASGIGAKTVDYFASNGINIVGVDINDDAGAKVMADAAKVHGVSTRFIRADVGNEADVSSAVRFCVDELGSLDMAVNNAGIEGVLESITTTKVEDFDHVVSVNLRGVFLCMKHQLIEMSKTGKGSIVNTASVMGLVGGGSIYQYVASKHGVVGLTKSAAVEFSTTEITINAICPGGVETPMVSTILKEQPGVLEPILAAIPAKRLAQTEEIAKTIHWLSTDAPAYLTGASIPVDGGFTSV